MRVLKNKLDFFPLSSAKVLIIIKMIPNYFCSSSRLSFSCSSKTLNIYYLFQGENIYVKTPLINLMKLPSETWRYNVDLWLLLYAYLVAFFCFGIFKFPLFCVCLLCLNYLSWANWQKTGICQKDFGRPSEPSKPDVISAWKTASQRKRKNIISPSGLTFETFVLSPLCLCSAKTDILRLLITKPPLANQNVLLGNFCYHTCKGSAESNQRN